MDVTNEGKTEEETLNARKAIWLRNRAEVTQDIGLSGELPVTAMVVGINGITCADEGVRDRTISARMLAHSVRDLNDPAGRR